MFNSIPLNEPIELINVIPYNPLISKCQIKVCYVGDEPNRNKSVITKETALGLAASLPGSPIIGKYNPDTEDFEEHNRLLVVKDGKFSLAPDTVPYGFVDLGAKVWFQKFSDNGVEREYLVTEGWLWTGQFPEAKRIIEKGNNQSMELDEKLINAHWSKDVNGNKQFFIINEAIISKLCILGEDYEPCFEGASITAPKVEFSLGDDFKEKVLFMMNEIKDILDKGGISVVEDNQAVAETPVEEPVAEPVATEEPAPAEFKAEEEKAEVCPDCGKPLDECECEEEDKKEKYNLDEIPEYIEIVEKYSALQNDYDDMKSKYSLLEEENNSLKSFKLGIERKEKEAMINKFYMLSDEDKKDVNDNIDTYSLDDIEAKLSVICVRNKVSFNLDEEEKKDEALTYSLNDDLSDASIPDWIKALQDTAKEF